MKQNSSFDPQFERNQSSDGFRAICPVVGSYSSHGIISLEPVHEKDAIYHLANLQNPNTYCQLWNRKSLRLDPIHSDIQSFH